MKNKILSKLLQLICYIIDNHYLSDNHLKLYKLGYKIGTYLDGDKWSVEFRKRYNTYISLEVRKRFKIGDWVFGLGEHVGCSCVFEGSCCDYQPFSYLNDFNPDNYRLATLKEIELYK